MKTLKVINVHGLYQYFKKKFVKIDNFLRYFITFIMDTTLGTFMCCYILQFIERTFLKDSKFEVNFLKFNIEISLR